MERSRNENDSTAANQAIITVSDPPNELDSVDISIGFMDTKGMQVATGNALFVAQEDLLPPPKSSTTWKQQLVLGTVHFCDFCSRVVMEKKKNFLWGGEKERFVHRKIVVYQKPNLIMILRPPKDASENSRLLDLPDDLGVDPNAYIVAETVVDPITCKLRLSPLTTVTSIENSSSAESATARRRTCFELITPTETILLSAFLPDEGKGSLDNSVGFLETKSMEVAIANALYAAHCTPADIPSSNNSSTAWKHQLVLGTLSSFVVSGSQRQLEKALSQAIKHNSDSSGYVSPHIIDELDESGRTALHYACERGSSSAVTMLIRAGANCSIPVSPQEQYPCHICALTLDEKSLSTILSASYPRRPDPNTVDKENRTAMYLAATEGKLYGRKPDAMALNRCLMALEAWGGTWLVRDGLRHPVSLLSSRWCHESLGSVIDRVPYRYPLPKTAAPDAPGASISALYQYPIHVAVVSLRKMIQNIRKGNTDVLEETFRLDVMLTLETLVGHGFEPNERLDRLCDPYNGDEELLAHTGFSPLQILAAAALDLKDLEEAGSEENMPMIDKLKIAIAGAAELLVSKGGRLNLDPPPLHRTRRNMDMPVEVVSNNDEDCKNDDNEDDENSENEDGNDEHCKDENSSDENTDNEETRTLPLVDRSVLKIQSNKDVMDIFGGGERLKAARKLWTDLGSVESTNKLLGGVAGKEAYSNSDAPGGSDEKSCAICWKQFGPFMNRKQKCHMSSRYVCDECSGKRVTHDGRGERISDGQFFLASLDAARQKKEKIKQQDQQIKKQREEIQVRMAKLEASRRERLEAEEAERAKRDSLFGGIIDKATNFILGEEDEGDMKSLQSSLDRTRDALNERGEKLNSLAEKTGKLVDASSDFAKMAKELERSQSGGLFW